MTTAQEIAHTHNINSASNPLWMDALRVLLGLFLFLKGIFFLQYSTEVFYIFSSGQEFLSAGKAHMLTSFVHIVGGLMIASGFLTRLALLCQFPILIGALLLVNLERGITLYNTELLLSATVTGLLLFFMIVGPGRYSVDNKVLRQKPGVTRANHKNEY